MKRKTKRQDGLSQVDLARKVPCSRSSVQRAVTRGDITPLASGRFPATAVDVMRAQRSAETAAADEMQKVKGELIRAKRDRERALADLRRIEVDVQAGKYVELERVRTDAVNSITGFVAVLRSIPQRTAVILDGIAAEPDSHRRAAKIYALMTDEVERCVAEMRSSLFVEIDRDGNVAAKGSQ